MYKDLHAEMNVPKITQQTMSQYLQLTDQKTTALYKAIYSLLTKRYVMMIQSRRNTCCINSGLFFNAPICQTFAPANPLAVTVDHSYLTPNNPIESFLVNENSEIPQDIEQIQLAMTRQAASVSDEYRIAKTSKCMKIWPYL
jgi:hypothetical protein